MSDRYITVIWLVVCILSTYSTTWLYVLLADEPNRRDYFRASTIFLSLLWCAIGMIVAFACLFTHISKL